MKNLIHEPFVHFVLLGGLLFAGHSVWQKHVEKTDRTIFVSPAEMERQAQIFASENKRPPSDADIEGLLFAYIEEQALMREAKHLGLDADDTIIRRRLAQKMRFMIDDIGDVEIPPREDLKTWFEENPNRFIRPETRSFEHVYLSPKGRSDTVVSEAENLLADPGIEDGWREKSDPFMTGLTFSRLAQPAVQRDFGTAFANNLFALPNTSDWQGPINSAFGVHLVRLTDVTPEFLPEFGTIQAEVEAVWLDDSKRSENEKALKTLIGKYRVEVAE
ncbi:MAG: peptidylprolyl isomerase [Litorimonas sp.]